MESDVLGGLLGAVGQLLGGDSGNPVDGLGDGLEVGLGKGAEAGNNGLLGVVGGALGGVVGLLIGAADNLGDSVDKIPLLGEALGGVLHLGSDLVNGLAVSAVAIVDGALTLGDAIDLGPISDVLNGESGGLAGGLGTGLQLGVEYGADVSEAGLAGSIGGIVGGLAGFAIGTLENLGIDLGGDVLPSQGDYLL
ncbi:hypothetical protein KXS07_34380 [Inquilinus limosus]|uniref:hypothetical protein n=1 Tax=Inquilinus limosus TaxID=171674 RepID=UPI003F1628F4